MRRIRKNDEVIIITGKDKGRQGKVLRMIDDKVIVDGVNLVKKTLRANPDKGEPGGVKQQEAPVHISNVQLFNPAIGKGDRVGFRLLDNGKKVRYFKSDGKNVD